jgi:hypothetical protein
MEVSPPLEGGSGFRAGGRVFSTLQKHKRRIQKLEAQIRTQSAQIQSLIKVVALQGQLLSSNEPSGKQN